MAAGRGGRRGGGDVEDLILRTVAAHADSLLRTARRYSLCLDDAHDAYQRALEIFLGHAEKLDPKQAAPWLHVVVKREAQTIRRSRRKLVGSDEAELDEHEAPRLPTPEERLETFDLIGRSAEALQRLKPQELRALWLRAQGHSYNDIGAMTGWSYTKVNRCLSEGRRAFLQRYGEIESGAECKRWLPVISAVIDGEATPAQMVEIRPHLRNCPGCRSTLRALRDSSKPLSVVFPIPFVVAATPDAGEHVSSILVRIYEMVATGIHDRAAATLIKTQQVVEATAAGKVAAIAGTAAAVAGGGAATVERTVGSYDGTASKPVVSKQLPRERGTAVTPAPPIARRIRTSTSRSAVRREPRTEFTAPRSRPSAAPEFSPAITPKQQAVSSAFVRAARAASQAPATGSKHASAPEFGGSTSPEFEP